MVESGKKATTKEKRMKRSKEKPKETESEETEKRNMRLTSQRAGLF